MANKRPVLFINKVTHEWTGLTATAVGAEFLQEKFPDLVIYTWAEIKLLKNATEETLGLTYMTKKALGTTLLSHVLGR